MNNGKSKRIIKHIKKEIEFIEAFSKPQSFKIDINEYRKLTGCTLKRTSKRELEITLASNKVKHLAFGLLSQFTITDKDAAFVISSAFLIRQGSTFNNKVWE